MDRHDSKLEQLTFVHRFKPGTGSTTLLLFHGTGGDENDLLELGQTIDPNAALLSPRGKVLENGAPRFFRRLAEGIFDELDVIRRATELAEFVQRAVDRYELDPAGLVAVGYSNGANIAAAILLLGVASFRRAILFRPMVPLSALDRQPDLSSTRVLLAAGKFDPIARADIVTTLGGLLRGAGARVDVHMAPAGHELSSADVTTARDWLIGSTTANPL